MSYARAIPFLVAIGFLVWALLSQISVANLEKANASLISERDVALAANDYLRDSIELLEKVNKSNDALLLDNAQRNALIMQSVTKMRDDIAKIKVNSDAVQAYLSTSVPDDIKRLLNTPAPSGAN